jgi:nitrite reductase/ring-hydroxylating ferredoxin subunit
MTEPDQAQADDRGEKDVSRRMMLRGAAVGGLALPLLAACGGGGDDSSNDASSSGSSGDSGSSGGSGDSGSSGATIAASDVPVDGGMILKEQKVVVTQPSKGDFKAFTAVCTHQGCVVGEVTGKKIVCPCHGSEYSITDGSVLRGPASSPLEAKKVSVKGGEISVT